MAESQYPIFQKPSIVSLFLSFFRLGITAFGGPAMVAYIRKMAVEQRHWLDGETFRDGVVLCQMIPGATAMQTAAYVGLRIQGVAGAAASFIGFGLPAFILMMAISALYTYAHTLPTIISAFNGLQVIIVAIVANATLSFGKTSLINWGTLIIAIISATLFGVGINPILVIPLAALLGLLLNNDPFAPLPILNPAQRSRSRMSYFFLVASIVAFFSLLFLTQRSLFDLAVLMFRIDLFAFGGGFASIPLMYHEIVEARAWMDGRTFLDGIALGQVTPGPIVITATFVGYMLLGPLGGLIATISVFSPSFLIVVGVAPYYDKLRASRYFSKAFSGIMCSFVGLLLTVTFRFALNVHWDFARLVLAGAAFVALLLKIDILWVVLIGAAISIIML